MTRTGRKASRAGKAPGRQRAATLLPYCLHCLGEEYLDQFPEAGHAVTINVPSQALQVRFEIVSYRRLATVPNFETRLRFSLHDAQGTLLSTSRP